jgi:flavin-dependent dehydrogenase
MSDPTHHISPAIFPNGGKVVIIGGGPGGTACALALHKYATQLSIDVDITIIEGKEFSTKRHHNQCVGVLSPPLPSLLEDTLGIQFPTNICIGEIERYILYNGSEQIRLNDEGEPSIAVRRVQFDAYMLDQASTRGIRIHPARAVDLEFHANNVIVYTENTSLPADVVVGAFGMDEGSAAMFARTTAYRSPLGLDSVMVNYPIADHFQEKLAGCIHAYLPANRRIEFGAITPKCDHLTINIAGRTVDTPLMRAFLEMTEVRNILPENNNLSDILEGKISFYKGRFPRSLARGFYGDRYVMVGDASGLVRAFKGKGATTAMLTGIRAAETIINHGVSYQAFHHHYRSANQDIIQDLPYGRGMRLLTMILSNFGVMGIILRAGRKSPALRSALFGAVSGHTPYRKIIAQVIHPKVALAILGAFKNKSA